MIIDSSAYIGNWPFWNIPHLDVSGDGLVELMNRYSIGKSVIISLDSILYDDEVGNELTFNAAKAHPDRLFPAVTVSPTNICRDGPAYLESLVRRGAVALKLYPFYHSFNLSSSNQKLKKLLCCAQELKVPVCLPVRLFMNWGLPALSVGSIQDIVTAYPEIRFLVENFNAGEFLPLVTLAEQAENLFLGTAALTRYRGVYDMVMRLGGERVIGGMCAPVQYPNCGIIKISQSEIEPCSQSLLLGDNSMRLFGIA